MIRAAFLSIVVALGLAACNTVAGVGEDMSIAGDVVSDSARGTQRHIN